MNKKISPRDVGFLSLILIILMVTVFALKGMDAPPTPSSAEIRTLLEQQQVETVKVKDNTLTMTLKEPWNGSTTV